MNTKSNRKRKKTVKSKYSIIFLASIFIIGLILGVLIGSVAYLLSLLLSVLREWLAVALAWIAIKIGGLIGLGISIWIFLGFVVIALLSPFIFGRMIGHATFLLVDRIKRRQSTLAHVMGLLNSLLAYIVFQFITIQNAGTIKLCSATFFEPNITPWWLYVLVCVDGLIVILTATLIGAGAWIEDDSKKIRDFLFKGK